MIENGELTSDINKTTASLYYSRNGGEKVLILEDVSTFWITESAIYVFAPHKFSVEGEDPLYDLYGGTSVDNIKFLVEGVYLY